MRLVRECLQIRDPKLCLTRDAAAALQECSEFFLVELMGAANLVALNDGRVTLMKKDMVLVENTRK